MIRWLRSLVAWRVISVAGCWQYEVNGVSGQRRARRLFEGYSPLNWQWLLAGNGMPRIDGIAASRSQYRDSLPDGWYWD